VSTTVDLIGCEITQLEYTTQGVEIDEVDMWPSRYTYAAHAREAWCISEPSSAFSGGVSLPQ